MMQRHTISMLALALGLALPTAAALAQASQPASAAGMGGMEMHGSMAAKGTTGASTVAGPDGTAATAAFQAADKSMMQKMAAPYTGDTDKDFVAHMMPHHEGAVEMAKIELEYGKDPALKRLAREIVRSQDREIAFMKKWQAQHGAQ
ncbi:MAG: CopM family metallochaperone [Janthinobacterium lividum]